MHTLAEVPGAVVSVQCNMNPEADPFGHLLLSYNTIESTETSEHQNRVLREAICV